MIEVERLANKIGSDELMMLTTLSNGGLVYMKPHWTMRAIKKLIDLRLVGFRLTTTGKDLVSYLVDEGLI